MYIIFRFTDSGNHTILNLDNFVCAKLEKSQQTGLSSLRFVHPTPNKDVTFVAETATDSLASECMFEGICESLVIGRKVVEFEMSKSHPLKAKVT